ncbi:MAG: HAMP domain-containing sensor histidine kinase [Prolixibacteraceae bacterium]
MFLVSGIVMLLFLDLVWIVNYGGFGPALLFFFVLYSFLILLFEQKYYWLITVVFLINFIGFYILESTYPQITGHYPDTETRLSDLYSGAILGIMVILSILSAIKRNYLHEFRRAQKSDQLKSAFLANMSHEIRTPLNAIVGFSSILSDPDIPEANKKDFDEHIQRNSDYLLQLIEDIIDVSKIEANLLDFKPENIDVIPLIRKLTASFQLSLPNDKNLKIVENTQLSDLWILMDKLRFEQILRNLIANAVKFTETGSIEVGCNKGKGFVTFSVKDTGLGIHPDDQQVIFERFMKVENNKQHLYRGTGIGLFLTKQLVEMFGGKIWLESELEKGTTFYFTVPA